MDIAELANFLAWCSVINYGVLIIWFTIFAVAHDWLHLTHGKWFELSAKQFDIVNYGGMGLYKLLIFLFNLSPYIALRMIG